MSILPFCKKGSSWIITFEDFELRGLRGESHTAVVWQLFESGQFDFEAAFEPTLFLCIDPSVLFLGKECHSSLFLLWCCSYLVYSENNGGGLPVCSEHAWSPANTGQGKYNMTTKLHTFSSLRVKKEQKLHKWVNTGTDWRTGQERAEILAGKRPVNPVRFSLCVPLPKQTRTACTVYLHRRKRNECKGLEFGWDPT